MRQEVAEFAYLMSLVCLGHVPFFVPWRMNKSVTNAVGLHVRLLTFTWNHEFKVLKGGPFPVILGLDVLDRTLVDVGSKFSFRFARDQVGSFIVPGEDGRQPYLIALQEKALKLSTLAMDSKGDNMHTLRAEFPVVFQQTWHGQLCPL
jgi:hypothetical protein